MMNVRALVAGTATENEVLTTGFGEDERGRGYHVLLSSPEVRTEEDEYDHSIADAAQRCSDDCVERWGLDGSTLVIELTDAGAEELGVDGGWRVELEALAPGQVEELKAGLARVLANVPRDDSLAQAPT